MMFQFPLSRNHADNFVVAFAQFEQLGPFGNCTSFVEIWAECPENPIEQTIGSLHIKFKHN
jgi:hypothetical protein